MSEPPAKKSPWSKYYAERGMTRPPMADTTRPLFSRDRPDAPPDPKARQEPAAPSPELAAAIAAVTASMPAASGSTAAPFITAMQKEAIARELKRRARRRLLRFGGMILAAVIAVPVVGTLVFNRTPAQPALAAHTDKVAAAVLALHSSVEHPLMIAGAIVRPLPRIGLGHLRYEVVVTLQLRAPLYVPAHTNGTEAYRMLQRSLAEARERASKLRLFRPPAQAPELPNMPLLLQLSHRAGEPVVVRVPFDAHRFGWRWRLEPPDVAARASNRSLTGAPLASYAGAGTGTLVFGSPESLAEVRRLVRLARDYVTAVSKGATVTAVADAPAVEAPAAGAPSLGALDPNAPAKPDPNAPAQPAQKPPALIDPNAPAVPRPKLSGPPR